MWRINTVHPAQLRQNNIHQHILVKNRRTEERLMMKHKDKQGRPDTLKQRFAAALAMLLVSSVLLTTVTYAWLSLSTSPEVTGITTNIAANGSLEIALLTTETRQDLSKIKTAIGQSLANNKTVANNTWGNLVDLNDASYGLGEIALLPARLNVKQAGGGYTVGDNLLQVPTYGSDGRIIDLTNNTLSALYKNNKFAALLATQDYGVRGIGTSNTVSVQASALALAKANISTYTNSARNAAKSAVENNINALFNIVVAHATNSSATFDDVDRDAIAAMLTNLQDSVDYIDLAFRQGMIAYAASKTGDEDVFTQVSNAISNASSLSDILAGIQVSIPDDFAGWIVKLEELQSKLDAATVKTAAMQDGEYTWEEIKDALNPIMNVDEVYIGEKKFANISPDELLGMTGSEVKMTLPAASGVIGSIADFTGDFTVDTKVIGTPFHITTLTSESVPHLTALYELVKPLEAADGTNTDKPAELTAMYGYALDLAFRTNAPLSDLLLQTAAAQRIYDSSDSASTLGGGSYMEFTTKAEDYPLEKMITLMDAVRVGFLDDRGTLLQVAKLNVSNRVVTDGVVKAPLYLYDFTLSEDEIDKGAMIMGERRKTDNTITALKQNEAMAITVVVWLDGDLVDNTMVASSSSDGLSLGGVLNLQFASSADLIPANNSDLMHITSDKNVLSEIVLENQAIYKAGQGDYTSVSWDAYAAAYEYAKAIDENAAATDAQILKASTVLANTRLALQKANLETLKGQIANLREWMGISSEDVARYVMKDTETGAYYNLETYTEEQKDQKVGTIYRVDYTKNLRDEGNGVQSQIYTDISWSNLAAALYDAETVSLINTDAGFRELDAAITALDVAYKALERREFYKPFEYEGGLYYRVIEDENNADPDTYGKWYDSDFKRIVSDLKILELDARAEFADVAEIIVDEYIKYNSNDTVFAPYIQFKTGIYPELSKDEILAIHWSVSGLFEEKVTERQVQELTDFIERANKLKDTAYAVDAELITAAQSILNKAESTTADTASKAEAEIALFNLKVAVLLAEQAKADADASAAIDKTKDPMTADQRVMLTKAVSVAKTITGYADETKTELEALRTATKAAEELLAANASATMQQAEDALVALNAQLVANNKAEVTAYNTIQHKLPIGSEIYEIGYVEDISATLLRPTQDTGFAEITAVVLTKNGMVFTAKKTVTVYAPAEGVEIKDSTYTKVEDKTLAQDATWNISVDLIPCADIDVNLSFGEEIDITSVTWASSDTKVLKVSGYGAECMVTAVGAGTAKVSVSVKTVQGNVYTTEVVVTVS